jgi:hypothetical protein
MLATTNDSFSTCNAKVIIRPAAACWIKISVEEFLKSGVSTDE